MLDFLKLNKKIEKERKNRGNAGTKKYGMDNWNKSEEKERSKQGEGQEEKVKGER